MSAGLFLQRFDPSSNDAPIRPGIVPDLVSLARRVLAEAGEDDIDIDLAADGEGFTIDLDGGTAALYATHGSFPLRTLDKTGIRLLFVIARAAGMVIVTEGGKYRAILTDPRQWDMLPAGWVEDQADAPVCRSAAELESLLGDWLDVHGRYADRMRAELDKQAVRPILDFIPGTRRDDQDEYLYIEAHAGEAGWDQFRRANRHYRRARRAGLGNFPTTGGMGGTDWRLEAPTGEVFYPLWVSGDKAAWLARLRMFASSERRAVGHIVNSDTFVLDDGRSFPLSRCNCTKMID